MSKKFRAIWRWMLKPKMTAGKVTLVTVVVSAVVSTTTLISYFNLFVPLVRAANVGTSVTVLNTPPQWTVNAHETTGSATTTPTNAGITIYWQAIGTDSNSDPYYLLICKTSSAPTPSSTSTPKCPGGSDNLWAVSTTTHASGSTASAATTTTDNFPFATESNDWYGWICDNNASGAQCVATYTNFETTDGNYPNSNSPFVVNHSPFFFNVTNSGNVDPGSSETWTATATDTDMIRGGDTVRLFVCKSNDFSGGYCGSGGSWATSTAASFNPATSTTIVIPTQDQLYNAYAYVADQNNLSARAGTTSTQGTNSSFTVNNVAPSISGATVSVVNPQTATTTGEIILTRPFATSGPFQVLFTVTDNNSCLNASSGNEISVATTSVYRSGIVGGAASCQTAGNFNTNSCYPSVEPQTVITCTQNTSGNVCSGSGDTSVDWTCTFYLWYNADATDAGSVYASEDWRSNVQVTDDDGLLSSATTSPTGTEVDKFLAFNVSTTSVAYGGLQPGQNTSPFVQTTDLIAWGNTGLDEDLYGDTMCTTWTAFDSCDAGGPDATSKIPVGNQQAATSSLNYSDTYTYPLTASTSPLSIALGVLKTTSTSSPQTKNTYWGIGIPGAITLSGNYTGRNVLTAKVSNIAYW